jgi:hypothetical protein
LSIISEQSLSFRTAKYAGGNIVSAAMRRYYRVTDGAEFFADFQANTRKPDFDAGVNSITKREG